MKRTLIIVATVFCAAAAHAQTQTQTNTPSTASTPPPALISDTAESNSDSPAVRAAKRTAARRKAGITPKVLVVNETVMTYAAAQATNGEADDRPSTATNAPTPATSSSTSAPPASSTASRKSASASERAEFGPEKPGDSCDPRPAQNTSPLRAAHAPVAPTTASNAANARFAQNASSDTAPRAASPTDLPQSANAGPNRQRRP